MIDKDDLITAEVHRRLTIYAKAVEAARAFREVSHRIALVRFAGGRETVAGREFREAGEDLDSCLTEITWP